MFNGAQTLYLYNNTFYDCDYDVGNDAWVLQLASYNNLHYHSGSGQYYYIGTGTIDCTSWSYFDYNKYYSVATTTWNIDGSPVTALVNWQSKLSALACGTNEIEANSNSGNPGFDPDDGVVDGNAPTDFHLTSYVGNGRSGGGIGAYETGSEQIGVDWDIEAASNLSKSVMKTGQGRMKAGQSQIK